jgi:hypothetical protein
MALTSLNPREWCLMNVGRSIQKCIDEWQSGDFESAMLHACNAVDGTAKKLYPTLRNKERFTRFIRENYPILGPMAAPGINIVDTRWPVSIKNPTADGRKPDLADVIYSIHRCTHGHGDELPDGFQLIPDVAGPPERTSLLAAHGKVRLSDRTLFGMIAICVVCDSNRNQTVPGDYFLTFGSVHKLIIEEWWGRKAELLALASSVALPSVHLDFDEWTK